MVGDMGPSEEAWDKVQEHLNKTSGVAFHVSVEEVTKIKEWLKTEVYPDIIAQQKRNFKIPHSFHEEFWAKGYPYEGASGGAVTYEFTPTSIGVVFKVKAYGKELDLTNYSNW